MHNARLFERLELRSHEAALLNDIARRAATSLNLRDIAAATLDELRRLTGFDRAALLHAGRGGARGRLHDRRPRPPRRHDARPGLAAGLVERLQEEKVLFLDLPGDSPLPAGHAAWRACAPAAVIALYEEGRVVGALMLGSERGRRLRRGRPPRVRGRRRASLAGGQERAPLREHQAAARGQPAGAELGAQRQGLLHPGAHGARGDLRRPAGRSSWAGHRSSSTAWKRSPTCTTSARSPSPTASCSSRAA